MATTEDGHAMPTREHYFRDFTLIHTARTRLRVIQQIQSAAMSAIALLREEDEKPDDCDRERPLVACIHNLPGSLSAIKKIARGGKCYGDRNEAIAELVDEIAEMLGLKEIMADEQAMFAAWDNSRRQA